MTYVFRYALPHPGALIRVGDGFGDLHPWPELGDDDLETELAKLAAGRRSRLIDRALHFAQVDARARREGRSLLTDLAIPSSHDQFRDAFSLGDGARKARAESLLAGGFERIKFKVGFNVPREITVLRELLPIFRGSPVKFRLDFNGRLEVPTSFFTELSEDLLDRLDFIEDPYVFSPSRWVETAEIYGCRLGLDRELWPTVEANVTGGFEVCVTKPVREDASPICEFAAREMKRVVFTSALDHPLGQMAAAFEAGCAMQTHPLLVDTCGLLSHRVYPKNDFSERLGWEGPAFRAPEGLGFGFDDLLEALPWKKL